MASLAGLACVMAETGLYEQAVQLISAAYALWGERLELAGQQERDVDFQEQDHYLAVARSHLNDATWARAKAEGRAMTREQAIDYAQDTLKLL